MIYSLFVIAFLALALSSSSFVSAYGGGSPKCRVVQLSDVAGMNPQDGSAEGWVFTASSNTYTPGETLNLTITNTAGKTSFAGFLAFVEKPDATATNINQVGSFSAPLPSGAKAVAQSACTSTAVTQSSTAAKTVPYTFTWTAPAAGTGAVKARLAIVTTAGPFPFQFLSVDLTEASTTTTTTPAPGTTPAPNSAHQSGPLMIIIATMMAMGLAVMKIGF